MLLGQVIWGCTFHFAHVQSRPFTFHDLHHWTECGPLKVFLSVKRKCIRVQYAMFMQLQVFVGEERRTCLYQRSSTCMHISRCLTLVNTPWLWYWLSEWLWNHCRELGWTPEVPPISSSLGISGTSWWQSFQKPGFRGPITCGRGWG